MLIVFVGFFNKYFCVALVTAMPLSSTDKKEEIYEIVHNFTI